MSSSYRFKRIKADSEELQHAQKIVVVGAGFLGIELACQLSSTFPDKDVTLIEAEDQVVSRCGQVVQKKIMDRLQKLGVQVCLSERIMDYEESTGTFISKSGNEYPCDKYYIATGQRPLSGLLTAKALDSSGRIRVFFNTFAKVIDL